MAEEQIFNQEKQGEIPTSPETNPVQPTVPPELADWVGPGKKYATVDEVYKAFPNAQNHIKTQQEKIAELEAELERRKSAEDVLNEIKNSKTEQQTPTSQGVEVNQSVLSELVRNELKMYKTQEQQQTNWQSVEKAFVSSYKEKAEEQFRTLAQENDMTVEDFMSLAKKNPKLVLKAAGLVDGEKVKPSTNINSDVNTQALLNQGGEEIRSAKVKQVGATSKDLANAWAATRQKVYKQLNIEE